jgi:hypothetical protein
MQAKGWPPYRVEGAALPGCRTPSKMQPCGPTSGFLLWLSLLLVLGRRAAFSCPRKQVPGLTPTIVSALL